MAGGADYGAQEVPAALLLSPPQHCCLAVVRPLGSSEFGLLANSLCKPGLSVHLFVELELTTSFV